MAYTATKLALTAATPSAAQTIKGVRSCSITLEDTTGTIELVISDDGDAPAPATDPIAGVPAGSSWRFDFGETGLPISQTVQFTIESDKTTIATIETTS